MIILIQWLIFGHIHHWHTLDEGGWINRGDNKPSGKWYDQECTECGKRRYYQSG